MPPPASSLIGHAGSAFVFLGETAALAASALSITARGKCSLRQLVHQMASIGVDSLPIVIATSLSTGAVVAFYTSEVFLRFGAGSFAGGIMTLTILLELGPVIAGISVASRSGAAIAAEIGSMAVTEQVDALRALAISPSRYLVAPRVVACTLMMPLAGLASDAAGVCGSIAMSAANGISPEAFLESARNYASETDLLKGLVKTVWFGFTVAVVACHTGLATTGGASGVGRSTTRSVVLCVVLIFVSDFFLAQLLRGAAISVR
jgi:phospholipid/cholesterol/gamma-HCH transport system permease protein